MKKRNGFLGLSKGLGLILFVLLAFSSEAFANRLVIDELRKLKSSLAPQDPSRKELTLRLADRLAEECLIGKEKNTRGELDRKEAIALYQEVLPSIAGASHTKIQFQLARLYAEKVGDLSAQNEARNLFEKVASETQEKSLKRESMLRLAEIAESNPKTVTQSSQYYRQVLTLCEGTDSCSFAHYRLAWIARNEARFADAIEEMKLALWDSKGQIREESLRDLISFMGLASSRTDSDLAYVDQLVAKTSRTELLENLAYSYFTSGNKASGVKVLSLTHSRHPTLDSEIRLMEEYYGLRAWDQFRQVLSQFQTSLMAPNAKSTLKDAVESEKICRRLATQLDGERTSDATHFDDFKQFTLSYLNLFPASQERAKIMEGYIAAEPNVEAKLSQLKIWLTDNKFNLTQDDQINFHELRAAIAQKEATKNEKMNEIVRDEMTALLAFESTSSKVKTKARDYRYARARALYALKSFDQAIPEFKVLASVVEQSPDLLAIQSQNLILDIYNQQKNLDAMVEQANTWIKNPALQKNQKIASDLAEMEKVSEQARFEKATQMGTTQAALDQFTEYCLKGQFLPKSCDNAKVLAVNLSNHLKLISVLEVQSNQNPAIESELASEYENGAYFSKAAKLLQKTAAKTPDFKEQLKIALMQELGRDLLSRDASLRNMITWVGAKKMKLSEIEEKALYATLKDAGLLDAKILKVASSNEIKTQLAESLEEMGRGTPETKSLLLSSGAYQGKAWSNLVLARAEGLSQEVMKLKFYGKNGQVLFQKRVNRLKELNQFSEKYLSGGADLFTRVKILTLLKQNYEAIQNEILNSPMPANLSEEQLAQVKSGLTQMAAPFGEKTTSLQALLDQEKIKAATPEEKLLFSVESTTAVGMSQSSAMKPVFEEALYQKAVLEIHQNPKNTVAWSTLKTIFENAGLVRLSSYFEGRIQALGGKSL